MNKTEFIKAIADTTGLSTKDAAAAVAAALETITQTIKE
jgi:nucleoid DNA-binding protein